MRIWHLKFEVDEYDNLTPAEEFDLDEIQSFDGRRKINDWKPMIVKKIEDKPLSNAPGFSSHIPVIDKLALEKLYDIINDFVEILPLQCSEGEYYALNITEVLDCIDYEKSEYKTFSDGIRIMRFIKYSFREDKVNGKHIFKIVDEPRRRPFVSDEFRQRVLNSNLTGFKFELAWDSENSNQ